MGFAAAVRVGVAVAAIAGCEVAAPSDDILPPDQDGSELTPCAPPESAVFRATLDPTPDEARIELSCEATDRADAPGFFVLDLRCGEVDMRLVVEAAPAPARDGLAPGQWLRVTAIRADGEAGVDGRWLRVEAANGRLLLASAVGTRLGPPDETPWASPFAWREAPSTCMVEETGCGASQRGAVDLQLSGGEPVRLYDGTSAIVGDKGSFAAFVEAARATPEGSACPRELALGLLATR